MNGLSFFRPEFLWASAFILLVLLIHFFKRPKLINIAFSTLRFFNADALTSSSKRKISKILQLLIRIAAIIALVLIFARPYNSHNVMGAFGNPQVSVFVWIDNTYSMEYTEKNKSIKIKAFELIDTLQQKLPSTGKIFLFDHQAGEYKIYSGMEKESKPVSGALDIRVAAGEFTKEQLIHSDAVLMIVSDFQKKSFQTIDSVTSELKDNKSPVVLVSYVPENPWNYSIWNVSAFENYVSAEVRTFGKTLDAANVVIKQENIKLGEISVSIPKNSDSAISIETDNFEIKPGNISLNVNDPMAFDNFDYFSSEHKTSEHVLVVGDTSKNNVIGAALRASGHRNNRFVKLAGENNVTYDELDSSDLVIINALRGPSQALNVFLMSGGTSCRSIVFCIGATDTSFVWSREILKKTFPDLVKTIQIVNGPLYPVLPDTVSAFWKTFPSKRITDVFVNQYVKGFNGKSIAAFNNGDTFMWSTDDCHGKEWIILSTSGGVTNENNLFQTAFYVPLIDRCVSVLSHKNKTNSAVWNAGESYRNPWFGSADNASVITVQGESIMNITGMPVISLNETGVYKIVKDNESPVFVKVHVDPQESVTDYVVFDASRLKNRNAVYIESKEFINSVINRFGTIKSMVLWMILLLLLISETYTWRRDFKLAS